VVAGEQARHRWRVTTHPQEEATRAIDVKSALWHRPSSRRCPRPGAAFRPACARRTCQRSRQSARLAGGGALVDSGTRGAGIGNGLCGLRLGRHYRAAGAHGPGLSPFRCRDCGKQYNERSGSLQNHTQYPSDVIALIVIWQLLYWLTLRDLSERRRWPRC
jgi:hypothetical protein